MDVCGHRATVQIPQYTRTRLGTLTVRGVRDRVAAVCCSAIPVNSEAQTF